MTGLPVVGAIGALSRAKKIALGALVTFLVVAFIVWRFIAWGNSRYEEGHTAGVTETDHKWEEAKRRLEESARASATRADDAAIVRLDEYKEQVDDEAKQLEQADRDGTSALDVLFGN